MRLDHNRYMKTSPFSFIVRVAAFFAFCVSAIAAGSGGNGNHRGVKVTISPSSSTLQVGQSLQFNASVSGMNNGSVNWLVNGMMGGNSGTGTISSSGLYTAPATVLSSSVTITAQSATVPTASANAIVSITAPSVSVAISPTSTSVQVNQSKQFNATVSGTSNTTVNWLVNGIVGGDSALGTISSSGIYIAPTAVPSSSITVTAQSAAQPSAAASATVSISPVSVSVSISPTNASVMVGQSQQFGATLSGAGSGTVNWLVSGVFGGNSSVGTVSTTGLYTAPTTVPPGLVTVTAQSASYPASSANASVTVTQPVSHSVSLSWTETSSSVVGYYIYRGAQPTGPFNKLNSSPEPATVYTDSTVVGGQTYYYATTAVNSTGAESAYSKVAQALIP